jgi:hypothetical protein
MYVLYIHMHIRVYIHTYVYMHNYTYIRILLNSYELKYTDIFLMILVFPDRQYCDPRFE